MCCLCYDYFWNHQIIVLCCWTWKTICLSHAFRTLYTVWVVTSLATASLLSSGKVDLSINQVSTLSCNQTCQLKVKFMQLCCNWTNSWLVHVTSSQVNLGLFLHAFCMFHAINIWSSSCTLVQMNCQPLNVFVQYRCNRNCVIACPCTSSALDCLCLQCVDPTTIADWGVVLTTTDVCIAETSLQ